MTCEKVKKNKQIFKPKFVNYIPGRYCAFFYNYKTAEKLNNIARKGRQGKFLLYILYLTKVMVFFLLF